MFINHTNTLLPLWQSQSLIWLEYEIVFSFANCTIVDSIFFSHLHSTARRVCAKTTSETNNGPTRDVPNEAPSKICMRPHMQVPHENKSMLISRRVLLLHEKYILLTVVTRDTGHNIYLVWLHFIVSAHAISSKPS
jgi:hypothetical protein